MTIRQGIALAIASTLATLGGNAAMAPAPAPVPAPIAAAAAPLPAPAPPAPKLPAVSPSAAFFTAADRDRTLGLIR